MLMSAFITEFLILRSSRHVDTDENFELEVTRAVTALSGL